MFDNYINHGYTKNMNHVGGQMKSNLKLIRETVPGLTQLKLANAIGFKRGSSIGNIEQGKADVSLTIACRVQTVLAAYGVEKELTDIFPQPPFSFLVKASNDE